MIAFSTCHVSRCDRKSGFTMGNILTSRTSSLIQPNNHRLLGNHFMPHGEEEDSKTQKNMGMFFCLPDDTIADICDYFTFSDILLLCTVSKGMLVAVSQDRIWKFVYEKKVHWFSGNTPQENICLKREDTCCWKAFTLIKYTSRSQQLSRLNGIMECLSAYNEDKRVACFFSDEIVRSHKEFERKTTDFANAWAIVLTAICFFIFLPLADFMFLGWVRWLSLEEWLDVVYILIYTSASICVHTTVNRLATKFYLNGQDGFHGLTRQETFNRCVDQIKRDHARALENISSSEAVLKKYRLDAFLKRQPWWSPMRIRIKRMLPT